MPATQTKGDTTFSLNGYNDIEWINKCSEIKDCYNCTLFNCIWQKGNCNDGNSNILTYSDMFERGSACNDDENRCSFVNTTQVMTDFSFSRDKNRDLPANFFCIFNFNQPSDYSNFLI